MYANIYNNADKGSDYKHPDIMTYWVREGTDEYNQPAWSGPHTSRCRWEDEERLYIDNEGREARGRSTVYVAEDLLKIGDRVMRGESVSTSPDTKSWEVRQPRTIPSLLGDKREYRYIV